jgi:hypothetical protein
MNTILTQLRIKYLNAREWYFRNWDNPKENARAMKNYMEISDTYHFFLMNQIEDKDYELVDVGLVGRLEAGK